LVSIAILIISFIIIVVVNKINYMNCNCEMCKQDKDFEIPGKLLESLIKNEVIIFAGAGVSTENKKTFPFTLYEDIYGELGKTDKNISFPALMQEYELKNTRIDLIKTIKERIDYINSFPELYGVATRFHTELSYIPMIRNIITTNWDDYFEKECDAIPFVNEEDVVFIEDNEKKRKVLKIHGSINNIGSIVATTNDYKKCKKKLSTGLLGSKLKLLLTNKVVIFIGYSFNDEDIKYILDFINKTIGPLLKEKYLVIPNEKDDSFLKKYNLKPIYTSGEYFLHKLRSGLEDKIKLMPNNIAETINIFLYKSLEEHKKLSKKNLKNKSAEIFYCQSYQDGLIHSYQYCLNNIKNGLFYDPSYLYSVIHGYEHMRIDKLKINKWSDIAYIDGYQFGFKTIISLIDDKNLMLPMFYYNIFTEDLFDNIIDFEKSFNQKGKNDSKIKKEMNNIIIKYNVPDDIIFHHPPFLF